MKNLLTVDLEDWFSVEVLKDALPPETWHEQESVVERNTFDVLDLFDKHEVKATFFVLGWIADKHPELIQEVARRGHEIACHSYYHRMVSSLTPDEFKRDTEMAITAIVKACGIFPKGYRSPTWGIKTDMTWAYDILAELDFGYDSSIFPTKHDLYGQAEGPREAHEVRTSSGKIIIEVPTMSSFGHTGKGGTPTGGGGWLRHQPYWYSKKLIKRLNDKRRMRAVIYFHPWELDRNLPENRFWHVLKNRHMPAKDWVRSNMGISTMKAKIQKLLTDFDFIPMGEFVTEFKAERKEAT